MNKLNTVKLNCQQCTLSNITLIATLFKCTWLNTKEAQGVC